MAEDGIMNDWIIFFFGCFAALLAASGAGILIFAAKTDVKD